MKRKTILLIDGIINLVLGILLISFLPGVVRFIGVPIIPQPFYARILGGVLFGIGIALLMEYGKRDTRLVGLDLGGAISINLCGGIVLGFLLIWGHLSIPLHGRLFLWSLVLLLVGISIIELNIVQRDKVCQFKPKAYRRRTINDA